MREVLAAHPEYRERFEPLPCNSGYFMCVRPCAGDAEVTLVDIWPEHVMAMRDGGLTIKCGFNGEEFSVPVRALHLHELQGETAKLEALQAWRRTAESARDLNQRQAAVAAERGHRVTLFERDRQFGGQARLAQALAGRAEFGGIITNLAHEVASQPVVVVKGTEVTLEQILAVNPDVVLLATGAAPRGDYIPGQEEAHVVEAWDVIRDQANVGARVVVADWRCDWVGMGVAEKLARAGCHVRIAVNGLSPGESVNMLVRDDWLGTLHRLGVEIVPNVRLAGVDSDSVYFAHRASGEAVICEQTDTLVLAQGHRRVAE